MKPGRRGMVLAAGATGVLHVGALLIIVASRLHHAAPIAFTTLIIGSAVGALGTASVRWREPAAGLLIPELFGLILFTALWLIGRAVGGGVSGL